MCSIKVLFLRLLLSVSSNDYHKRKMSTNKKIGTCLIEDIKNDNFSIESVMYAREQAYTYDWNGLIREVKKLYEIVKHRLTDPASYRGSPSELCVDTAEFTNEVVHEVIGILGEKRIQAKHIDKCTRINRAPSSNDGMFLVIDLEHN